MTYISDIINQDYLNWNNQSILISSRTGSGKTTFILKQLLPQAIRQDKQILYLCNRKILKDQFNKDSELEFKEIFPDVESEHINEYQKYIIIHSYQYFETLRNPQMDCNSNILYFVYDEAHYFLADSLFNNTCNYWFNRFFDPPRNFTPGKLKPEGTHIFLTATPEPLKIFLAAHLLVSQRITGYNLDKIDSPFIFSRSVGDIREEFIERSKLIKCASGPIVDTSLSLPKCKEEPISESKMRPRLVYRGEQQAPAPEPTPEPISESKMRPRLAYRGEQLQPITKEERNELLKKAKTIHPGKCLIEKIESNIKKINNVCLEYTLDNESPYKDMETTYWDDYTCLFDEICKKLKNANSSSEKWLIFVNKEEDGQWLEQKFINEKIDATLLSSSRLLKNKKSKEEYQSIVQTSQFQSKVLIATSVMDCGVSIKDSSVKNIVISESKKTTFLQMLGRKRLQNEEKVHLYIRYFDRKYITLLKHHYEEQLHFLVDYSYNQQHSDEPLYSSGYEIGYRKNYNSSIKERFTDFEKCFAPEYSSLFYTYYSGANGKDEDEEMHEVRERRQPGSSSFTYLLYLLSSYEKALDNNSEDKEFYLKEQLSWIGQTYSKENWLNQDKISVELIAKLQEYKNKKIIKLTKNDIVIEDDDVNSEKFSQDCMNILKEYPIPTKTLHRYLLGLKKGILPQAAALSSIFEELGIMYKVKSKQKTYHGQRVSMWEIIEQ